MLSFLSQLFVVERHRPRAGSVGFSVPAYGESFVVDQGVEPLLTTNMRGTFLQTRVSKDNYVRFGFSECPLDQELLLLRELMRVLVRVGVREGWDNTAGTPTEALGKMRQAHLTPKSLVAPTGFSEVCESVQVIVADIPNAIVVAQPEVAGFYTRIGDYVSILAQRVDTAFVVVL